MRNIIKNFQKKEMTSSSLVYFGLLAGLQIYMFALALTFQFMQDDQTTLVTTIDQVNAYVIHQNIETLSTHHLKEFSEIQIRAVNTEDKINITFGVHILIYAVLSYTIVYYLS